MSVRARRNAVPHNVHRVGPVDRPGRPLQPDAQLLSEASRADAEQAGHVALLPLRHRRDRAVQDTPQGLRHLLPVAPAAAKFSAVPAPPPRLY